jgi:hypothetical protein
MFKIPAFDLRRKFIENNRQDIFEDCLKLKEELFTNHFLLYCNCYAKKYGKHDFKNDINKLLLIKEDDLKTYLSEDFLKEYGEILLSRKIINKLLHHYYEEKGYNCLSFFNEGYLFEPKTTDELREILEKKFKLEKIISSFYIV